MDQNLNDEFEMKIFQRGYWCPVTLGRHYKFDCPCDSEGPNHGFMIEPVVWRFCSQKDKDYEEDVLNCTGTMKDGSTCVEKMPYKIRRLHKRNA